MVLLWLGIKPKSDADKERLVRSLALMLQNDPSLAVKTDADGMMWLGAENEDQLVAVLERLTHEFEMEAAVTRPYVAYKEALTQAAEGSAKYCQYADGRQQYAHVKLRVAPGEQGSGYVFENEIIGAAIPAEYVPAIREGVAAGVESGVLAGYPIENVRVTVYDGSYHDVDSSADAFRHAARLAFRDAAGRARAVLLEPIMNVDVVVPAACARVVSDGLLGRRAEVFSLWEDEDGGRVRVRVPLAEMFGYRTDFHERTGGQGTYSMSPAGYAPVTLAGENGDPYAEVTAPVRPRTPLRTLKASVPEPAGDDGEQAR